MSEQKMLRQLLKFLLLLLLSDGSIGWLQRSVVLTRGSDHFRLSSTRRPMIPYHTAFRREQYLLHDHHVRCIRTTTSLSASQQPEQMQVEGNAKIAHAVNLCNVNLDDVMIEWKPGRIIVTVAADAVYMSNDDAMLSPEDAALLLAAAEESVDDEDEDIETDEFFDTDDHDDNNNSSSTPAGGGVDLTVLAKAINVALEDTAIAETHEIEVTTPGATDELQGDIMWKAYRGFDVIARYENPKTNKVQTLEGRLVERNEEHTVLNIKGRMRKLQNDKLQSVKLPKAKKEKGVK